MLTSFVYRQTDRQTETHFNGLFSWTMWVSQRQNWKKWNQSEF